MRSPRLRPKWPAVIAVLSSLFFAGCHKTPVGDTANPDSSVAAKDAGSISGQGDGEAVAFLRQELEKRWLKTPDGWLSEYPAKTYIATGQRAGPESFYRQIKELKFDVEPDDLTESDKLNGIQFRGECRFSHAPKRIYGDPNAFGPLRWSDWTPSNESVRVQKRNGQWSASDGLGYLMSGTKPGEGAVSQLR